MVIQRCRRCRGQLELLERRFAQRFSKQNEDVQNFYTTQGVSYIFIVYHVRDTQYALYVYRF